MIDAWYLRTLPIYDLDNGKIIPAPSEKNWKYSVRKDLKKLLSNSSKESKDENNQ